MKTLRSDPHPSVIVAVERREGGSLAERLRLRTFRRHPHPYSPTDSYSYPVKTYEIKMLILSYSPSRIADEGKAEKSSLDLCADPTMCLHSMYNCNESSKKMQCGVTVG